MAVFPAIPYGIDLIGGPYIETNEAIVAAFRSISKQTEEIPPMRSFEPNQ